MGGSTLLEFSAALVGGWSAWGRSLILVGLTLGVINTLRFIGNRGVFQPALNAGVPGGGYSGVWLYLRGGLPSVYWPLALVWSGFWIGTRFNNSVFAFLIGLLTAAAVSLAVRAAGRAHDRRGDRLVAGSVMAVILAGSMLTLFGLLLAVRLEVQPDPSWGVAGALLWSSVGEGLVAVLLPLGLLTAVLFALERHRPRPETSSGSRVVTLWTQRWSDRECLAAIAAVAILFLAPLIQGGASLHVLGVATPEYGKILYLAVLAKMLAQFASGFRVPGTRAADRWSWMRDRRHYLYPIAIFSAVGVASAAKKDFGPMIPLFAGSMTMVGFVLVAEVRRSLRGGRSRLERAIGRVRDGLRFGRPLLLPLLGLIVIGVVVLQFTTYVHERYEAWSDPWSYPWNAVCLDPVDQADGTEICRRPFGPAALSNQSQIARALAVIADGGLWGRGLDDTVVSSLPARSTDFVLAVVWNKLGGLSVLLLCALLVLLTSALTRTARLARGARRVVDPAGLFIAGVAGLILGQFMFVLLATLNVLPHAGITAPLLSRGGQSTVALGFGLIAAVALAYGSASPRATGVDTISATRPRSWWAVFTPRAGGVAFVVCLALVAGRTVAPYGPLSTDRPFCRSVGVRVDPRECSTDRIAFERRTVEIVMDGRVGYRRDREQRSWESVGDPAVSLADLSGLLQAGGEAGVLDLGLSDVINGGTGADLRERLLPPSAAGPTPGRVEVTVDPGLQRVAATALRDDRESAPLAGGIVVMDARSGRVLAAASAPTDLGFPPVPVAPVDERVLDDFNRAQRYHRVNPDGGLDDGDCVAEDLPRPELARCERLQRRPARPKPPPGLLAERMRYVGGDEGFDPPGEKQNRALGRDYGLGSTFKVVVAAAYLGLPGTSPTDEIEAPLEIPATHPIRNYGGGECPTSRDGRITVTQALAVSCNTAFVRLAQRVGWERVRDTARDLGFTIGPVTPGRTDPAWLAATSAGVDSRVPATLVDDDLGNNVLGGDRVVGTPLQMATVMGAIARGGEVIQPTLVDRFSPPGGREPVTVRGQTRAALSAETARELREALSRTTAESGTAKTLSARDGRPLWIKTGTHELFGGEDRPRKFAKQNSWIVGFMDTSAGPVSFAMVVETRDEKDGSVRVRSLAQQVINKVVEIRG